MQDPRKRDLLPTVLDFGPVRFILARHFGFCFGVENAVDIAYRTLEAHADRRVFFLSEMIHNPNVNWDLQERGVRFILPRPVNNWSHGTNSPRRYRRRTCLRYYPGDSETLATRGIDPYTYNTTCPFVEKVWKRSAQLGASGYTVVVHGKATHEETGRRFRIAYGVRPRW